jgi:hypothetical protein
LIAAMWFGAGVFLLIASTAAFRAVDDPTTAANVVGAMLTRWHYVALICPLLLLAFEWRRLRTAVIAVVFFAIVFATFQAIVDLRIRAMRMGSPVAISSLAPSSPVRVRFGVLHGLSSVLLLVEIVAAGVAVMAIERPES